MATTFDLTVLTNKNGLATKRLSLDADSNIVKAPAAAIYQGIAERRTITLAELPTLLRSLEPNQCLVHGVCDHYLAHVVTDRNYTPGQMIGDVPVVARTAKCFSYEPGKPALMMLDVDAIPGKPPLTAKEVLKILKPICPGIKSAGMVVTPSTSSCIYLGDKQLKGETGLHIYIVVQDGGDIPRFGKVLFRRLWLMGYGHIVVSKAGGMLLRTVIDESVFKAERIDFAAGAVCTDGLDQRLPLPVFSGGGFLDTTQSIDLTDDELASGKQMVAKVKNASEPEAALVKGQYIEGQAAKLVEKGNGSVTLETARAAVASRANGKLMPEDWLLFDSLGEVQVSAVLANLAQYDGQTMSDPVEPEAGTCKAIFYANIGTGEPIIHSFIHGGINYTFAIVADGDDAQRVRDALAAIHPQGPTDDCSLYIGLFLRDYADQATRISLAREWDRANQHTLYDLGITGAETILSNTGFKAPAAMTEPVNAEHIFNIAKERGWVDVQADDQEPPDEDGSGDDDDEADDPDMAAEVDQKELKAKRKALRLEVKAFVADRNKTWKKVLAGQRALVLKRWPSVIDDGKMEWGYTTKNALEDMFSHKKIRSKIKNDGTYVYKNPVKVWWNHEDTERYLGGLSFVPNGEAPAGTFNRWLGFGVEAEDTGASWDRLKWHIANIVCAGDEVLTEYVMGWLAHGFQSPATLPGVALVARGEKGTGKGVVGQLLMKLWGQHSQYISSTRGLTGQFNAHLGTCCFLFADEAFFAGDKSGESTLKALITEPTRMEEPKGIDIQKVRNFLKIFMCSNKDAVVPVSCDERRYAVCDVSDAKRGDTKYFNDLWEEVNDPVVQSQILWDLQHYDLSGFNFRKAPASAGLEWQALQSLSSVGKWWHDCLAAGYVGAAEDQDGNPNAGWGSGVFSFHDLEPAYRDWAYDHKVGEHNIAASKTALGIDLNKMTGTISVRDSSGGARIRRFGTLDEARRKFAELTKTPLIVD